MRYPRNNVARLPLMVLPGIAHHVTQRGDRRERTFFEDADYALHLDLLAEATDRHGARQTPKMGTQIIGKFSLICRVVAW